MKRVLVTGSTGFIGRKVGLFFQNKGFEVTGWDIDSEVSGIPTSGINMLSREEVMESLQKTKPDVVIHCAGSSDVAKSVQYPEVDFEGNVRITHNLLFALHKLGMESVRIVYLSSAGVYGNPEALPITEDMKLKPMSPYAVHKVMCEELCFYFHRNYGMDVKIARIFSAYGAGLKKQIFWDMYNKSKSKRLCMFGTGEESRDYIHIDDVVAALFILATTKSNYQVFNVANGEEVTIRTATEIFAKNVQIDESSIEFNGVVREGDPLNWCADISRIEGLGYKKSIDIETGIREYVSWCNTI